MRPIIGITCDFDWENNRSQLFSGYYEGVYRAGGLPFLIPVLEAGFVPDFISKLDGLILTGGGDVDPCLFDEEPHSRIGGINPNRDELELKLCKEALAVNMPVLGICRGCQVMNVAAGGTLYQDIGSQAGELICHVQQAPKWFGIHQVNICEQSKLQQILGSDMVRTNSFHHQAVKDLGRNIVASAYTQDGIIEGIESDVHPFYVGVQWHPEQMLSKNPHMQKLFEALVEAANKR